ncbi:MAG: sigma 54-interacting transcriptional regulator [Planctomycetes bacterium]|nr:sigma 54-interacting transcriptional regulator [Planctomycetota bacterium]
MARLTVVEGPDIGSEYELPAGDRTELRPLILGRDPEADVSLADGAVSRRHCRIDPSSGGFRLVDLASRNRTFINDEPIDEYWLRDGDVIRIGDTEIRFEDDAPAVDSAGAASTIIKSVSARGAALGARLAEGEDEPPAARTDVLRRALARMESIADLSRRIVETRSMPQLLREFLAELEKALDASQACFLVPEEGGWVAKARTRGEGSEAVEASLSVVESAAAEGQAVLSAAAASDDRFRGQESIVRADIRSAMALPILVEGRLGGVVYVDRRGEKPPLDEDALQFLRAAGEPLAGVLQKLEEQGRLAEENRNLLRSLTESHRIIGQSPAMLEVLDFIQRAAPTSMTVLIQGETGTGKEIVATAIHYGSPRRGRPFVALNCAALPESLVESELFGHERGAFTGAVKRKKGRFELADTGTIFLDEVSELSLACQAKLLRLLEERSLERVGGTETVSVDVRIIAATNRDLLEAVGEGKFREDLFYRLSVLQVSIPPLRERAEDIPPLAEHFLARACAGGRPKKLSRSAAKKLLEYEWPGNVRQLRNVIESATVLGRGEEIKPADLVLPAPARGSAGEKWEPISLQELEKRHVLKVLQHTRGNKKKAAEILGIERCTLYSKLKSYEL